MVKIIIVLVLLELFYVYTILPRTSKRRETLLFTDTYYAHRGLHNLSLGIPENSMTAFVNAVEKGYGIELDVQLTKDEKLVVFHDTMLSRVCGIDLPVSQKTYAQLRELNLFKTDEKIPLLEDVLKVVDGKVPLLIEIKLINTNTRVCFLLNQLLSAYKGAYMIESFNTFALHWYKKHRPDIIRGQLSANLLGRKPGRSDIVTSFLTTNLMGNCLGRPDFIAYCYHDTYNLGYQILKRVLKTPTFAWTLHSEEAYKKYHLAFHSVIFENFIPE